MISPPSSLRPVYEQILAHYHVRRALPAPAVQRAVESIRPEGSAHGADHTGFGTLLYACTEDDPESAPRLVPPAALHALVSGKAVELDWLRTRFESSAIILRDRVHIEVSGRSGSYRDTHVAPTRQFTYRLSTPTPTALTSAPVSIATGLPRGWKSVALGEPAIAGDVQFDGTVFTVCTAGRGLMQPMDEGHFIAAAAATSTMTVRFIPQVASQFAAFGLARRSGFAADAPGLALLIMPADKERGRRGWHVRLLARGPSSNVVTISDSSLNVPVVTYGRLMKSVWLRLRSNGSLLQAAFSIDGSSWFQAGEAPSIESDRIGFVAASGIPEVSTAVRFEVVDDDRGQGEPSVSTS